MRNKLFKRVPIWLCLASLLLTLPAQGWSMFIPDPRNPVRQADLVTVRRALESRVVQQRLRDLGLPAAEALSRMNGLSDEQIHQFASRLDSVQAGADGVDTLIVVLLAAVIVMGVLELSGHSIIIR